MPPRPLRLASVTLGGLRLGECLGLKWADVNLKTGEIEIRQQATEVNYVVNIGPLKTKSSRRVIVVGPSVVEALRRRQAAARDEGHKSSFCFTTPEGDLLNRTYIRRRHFRKICEAAKISKVHPHDLRHTMTSHAIAEGLSPIVVAARLGHKSTRMTLDRYSHQMPGQQAQAAAALEQRFSAAAKSK